MDYYPLTLPQMVIWGLEKVYQKPILDSLCCVMHFKADTNLSLLEKAVNLTLEQHEGLRLCMTETSNGVMQYVSPGRFIRMEFIDFRNSGVTSMEQWIDTRVRTPIPLLDHDLFAFSLLRTPDGKVGLFIRVHHIIADGWSMNLLIDRITSNFQSLAEGKPVPDPEVSYLHYLRKQQSSWSGGLITEVLRFWGDKFLTTPGATRLMPASEQLKNSIHDHPTEEISWYGCHLPEDITAMLQQFCCKSFTSVYLVFLSVILIYLSRINQHEDTAAGTLFHNRLESGYQQTFGLFVTLVPIRIDVDPHLDFKSILKRVMNAWKINIKLQPTGLTLPELLSMRERLTYLFDVVFSYENHLTQAPVTWCDRYTGLEGLAALINLYEEKDGLYLKTIYQNSIYTHHDMERITSRLIGILRQALENPGGKVMEFRTEGD